MKSIILFSLLGLVFTKVIDQPKGKQCAKIPTWMKTSQSMNNRIVGGDYAPTPIPWQVHVDRGCGGTILDETTILSAAHCFYDPVVPAMVPANYIEAGHKVRASLDSQKIYIKETIIHPMYNEEKGHWADNDVAILKLKSPLTFNDNVQPACLPRPSFMPENTRELAVISGWGDTSHGGTNSNVLKYASVPLLTNEDCMKSYWITSNMVCAGFKEGGTDTCQNDSGGPLVVPRSSSDASAIIYGVVSHGRKCALPNYPGVYTRVAKYLDWIRSYMNSAGLENGGKECYYECKQRQGKCNWCGPDGWCCRKDWVGNGCDGTIGGPSNHQCTLN